MTHRIKHNRKRARDMKNILAVLLLVAATPTPTLTPDEVKIVKLGEEAVKLLDMEEFMKSVAHEHRLREEHHR